MCGMNFNVMPPLNLVKIKKNFEMVDSLMSDHQYPLLRDEYRAELTSATLSQWSAKFNGKML